MALYKEPIQELLDSIKTLNTVELIENQYTFGTSTAVPAGLGGDNTTLTITAKNTQSAYDGSVTVRYHRRDLVDLVSLVPLDIRAYNIQTKLDVALRLNRLYGLNFTADDIIDGAANLTDGAGTVTLVAKDTSRSWLGQVDVNLTLGDRNLSDFVTVSRLAGLNYPAPSTEKPYAAVYSYWRDFSTEYSGLSTVALGTDQIGAVLTALINITGDAWSSTVSQRFTLLGATVTYVGDTAGTPDSNTDYDKIVIVKLDETNSIGLSGSLALHYNLP